MSWTLINREHAVAAYTHYLFIHADGRRAIADHSISNLKDPAATDDGLLLLDVSRPVEIALTARAGAVAYVPVQNHRDHDLRVCTDPTHAVKWARDAGASIEFEPKSEKLLRSLVPYLPREAVPA